MEDTIHVPDKTVVVPGELIAEGMGFVPSRGTYRDGEMIRASRLGLVSLEGKVVKLIPLSGVYLPKPDDVIIARVIDVMLSGWRLDTYTPYSAVLTLMEATSEYIPKKTDLTRYFDIGDYLLTMISNVTSQNLVDVSMKGPGLRKLRGGRIIRIDPHKVPRLIGKKGSMVQIIKENAQCRMIVGQNGIVWIEGEPENEIVAVEAITMVERLAHTSGLTERIKQFLEGQKARIVNDPTKRLEDDDMGYLEERQEGRPPMRRNFEHRGPPNRGPPRQRRMRPEGDSRFKEESL